MSIRRPDLGPAGRGELDEPLTPGGLGPADRASLAGDPRWPTSPPLPRQPTAGSVDQPLGTEPTEQPGRRPSASNPDDPEIGDPEREDDRVEEEDQGFFRD